MVVKSDVLFDKLDSFHIPRLRIGLFRAIFSLQGLRKARLWRVCVRRPL